VDGKSYGVDGSGLKKEKMMEMGRDISFIGE
jgi:hypothetical protein